MLIIASRFTQTKPIERILHCTVVGESLRELPTEGTGTSSCTEKFQCLQEAIGRVECENIQHHTNNSDLSDESSRLRAYVPTHLAQEILLRFFLADTTELGEAEILEMYQENRSEVQAALADLCANRYLAAFSVDHTRKLYVVTIQGRSQCFSCQTRVGTSVQN
jgi:hypothetical protein